MKKCKGCQWYNKPYWSVVSPCNSCYKDEEITVYISPKGYGKSYHELEQRIDKVIHFILEENMPQRKTTKEEKIIIEMLRGEDK